MLPAGCVQFPVPPCCRNGESCSVVNSLDYSFPIRYVWGLGFFCLFLGLWGFVFFFVVAFCFFVGVFWGWFFCLFSAVLGVFFLEDEFCGIWAENCSEKTAAIFT